MSLLVCLASAAVAAVAYGGATAAEHSAAHGLPDSSGAGGLFHLLHNPRWLLGLAGDTFGLVFHVIALATGPVVLVQPILVLALPVSLPIARLLGGPRPGPAQYRACGWILAGLGVFFVLVGNPGDADTLSAFAALLATLVLAAAGVAGLVGVGGRETVVKAAVYGGVAGAWFGLVAVLMDAVAAAWSAHGVSALAQADGLVPILLLVPLGAASTALTQVAFRVGDLGASFPANLAADPLVAVVLGAWLLHENLPLSAWHVVAYVVCLAAVVFGSVRLASFAVTE